MSAVIGLYAELVGEALEAETATTLAGHMRDFYLEHPDLAFLRVLASIREVDVLSLPAAKVLDLARAVVYSGQLSHCGWFAPAVNTAREEFHRYKNYVACALSNFTECMAATGEFDTWAATVKLTDLQTNDCAMWRRIKNHRSGPCLSILHTQLAHRLQEVRLHPDTLLPPSRVIHDTQRACLANVCAYMTTTLAVAKTTLRSAWRESIHTRINRLASQARPGDLITKALEIPNFAPPLADIKEVCVCVCVRLK